MARDVRAWTAHGALIAGKSATQSLRFSARNGMSDRKNRLQRRQLILGLAALPALASASRAAAEQAALAILDQAAFAKPWAAVEFTFELDGARVPGIVIKLPDERWYASSLICPHAQCVARYFPDAEVARDTFDVDAKNPVLGCPCHFSVFDVANGGKVIAGPAPSPPLQLTVALRDGKVSIGR
jgi:nitrite reductase/ring-hydroxylating ferredoxin subunit